MLFAHWSPEGSLAQTVSEIGTLGTYGVQLFFVMSAFLITAILIQTKEKSSNSSTQKRGRLFLRFSARRALRIFPVYYGTLLAATLLLPFYPEVRAIWPIHASYLTGWYIAFANNLTPYCSHFWTLGVEEQYYLTWPLIVLFFSIRGANAANVSLIGISLLFNIFYIPSTNSPYLSLTLPAHLGSLGVGAWLAIYWHRVDQFSVAKCGPSWIRFALPSAIVLRVLLGFFPFYGTLERIVSGVTGLLFSFGFASLIARSVEGRSHRLLNSRVLQAIGMLSYCVYVIHPFVPRLFNWICDTLNIRVQTTIATASWLFMTFIAATASWFLIERPVLRLKRLL